MYPFKIDPPLLRVGTNELDLHPVANVHAVVATHYFVPAGQVGAGVWTSPTYAASTNTIYVSTGTKRRSQKD